MQVPLALFFKYPKKGVLIVSKKKKRVVKHKYGNSGGNKKQQANRSSSIDPKIKIGYYADKYFRPEGMVSKFINKNYGNTEESKIYQKTKQEWIKSIFRIVIMFLGFYANVFAVQMGVWQEWGIYYLIGISAFIYVGVMSIIGVVGSAKRISIGQSKISNILLIIFNVIELFLDTVFIISTVMALWPEALASVSPLR